MKILAFSPEDPAGDGRETDTKPSGTDPEPGTSDAKDVAGDGSGKGEDTKPDPKDADSAPDPKEPETAPAKGDDVSDEDLAAASKKVAVNLRRVRRDNVGLQAEVDSMQKDYQEAPELREKVGTLERENMILRLAGKHGLDPELLRPIQGSEEELTKWIQNYVMAPASSASVPDETDTSQGTDTGEGDGGEDKKDKAGKEPEPEIPDVDKGRPEPKDEGKDVDLSGMTHAEKLKYWETRI